MYSTQESLVLIASDRISAFDVVFSQGLFNKGKVLTNISNHWFSLIDFIPNHIIETKLAKMPPPFNSLSSEYENRTVYVHNAKRVNFECVVRGYLMGSGVSEYNKTGAICGNKLESGLTVGKKFLEPIFTPATKVDIGHDENVSFEFMVNNIGLDISNQLKNVSIRLYNWAAKKLEEQEILLLDTKFEFGFIDGKLSLIDEVLTPDSSRFCSVEEYENAMKQNQSPPSLDKQIIRNYLNTLEWNKQPPAPLIPQDILDETLKKYEWIEKKVLCIT